MAYPGRADAAEGDQAAAESLFQAARELMDQQRYSEACPKFAEAQRLDPTLGTLLNLAKCHESEGKIATAWAEYRRVTVLARKDGQEDRAVVAEDLAAKLEPMIPKLRIEAPHGPDGIIIKRDGVQLGAGALDTAIAVDPGEHTIEAFAIGRQPWAIKANIVAKSGVNTIKVPALLSTTGTTDEQRGNTPHPMRVGGFVMVGAGALALGIGAILGGSAFADVDRARNDSQLCPNNVCTAAGRSFVDGVVTKTTASNVMFIVGGIAAATGLVLVLAAPPAKSGQTSLQLVPTTGGLLVQGHY